MWDPKDWGRNSSEMFIAIYQSIRRHIQDVFNFEIGNIALQVVCRYICRALRPKNHVCLGVMRNTSWQNILLVPFKAQWLVYITPWWTSKLRTLSTTFTYVSCIIFKINSHYFHIQYSQTVVSNRSTLCSPWGMNYMFTYNLEVRFRLIIYNISGGKRGSGRDFYPCASVVACQHHCTTAPHSLHDVFNSCIKWQRQKHFVRYSHISLRTE